MHDYFRSPLSLGDWNVSRWDKIWIVHLHGVVLLSVVTHQQYTLERNFNAAKILNSEFNLICLQNHYKLALDTV